MVIKRGANVKKTLYSNSMQHDMPQSLLVFAVFFTPETPSFGTFGGVAHPPPENFFFVCLILLSNCVYAHI